MKFIVEITQLDTRPTEWTTKSYWPGKGVYQIKDDTSLYVVHEYGVDYISYAEPFNATPYVKPEEQVSESLLLKAIAAASRAENLR